jgi:hypothetical protein
VFDIRGTGLRFVCVNGIGVGFIGVGVEHIGTGFS